MILSLQWNWQIQYISANSTTTIPGPGWGPTDGTQLIQPAQFAGFAAPVPTAVPAGQPYTVCLDGTESQGRTFSLHAVTVAGLVDFEQANATATPGWGPQPFCWQITIPASISPQPILIRVWNYVTNSSTQQVSTFLLYSISVQLNPALATLPPILQAIVRLAPVLITVAVIALAVLAAVLLLRTRRRGGAGRPPAVGRPEATRKPVSRTAVTTPSETPSGRPPDSK